MDAEKTKMEILVDVVFIPNHISPFSIKISYDASHSTASERHVDKFGAVSILANLPQQIQFPRFPNHSSTENLPAPKLTSTSNRMPQ